MNNEKTKEIQLGDTVLLEDGTESPIIAIYMNPSNDDYRKFCCLDSNGFSIDEETIHIWGILPYTVIDNFLDYRHPLIKDYRGSLINCQSKWEWFSIDKIKSIIQKANNSPIKSSLQNQKPQNNTSCTECQGSGIIDTGFYTRTCSCRLG